MPALRASGGSGSTKPSRLKCCGPCWITTNAPASCALNGSRSYRGAQTQRRWKIWSGRFLIRLNDRDRPLTGRKISRCTSLSANTSSHWASRAVSSGSTASFGRSNRAVGGCHETPRSLRQQEHALMRRASGEPSAERPRACAAARRCGVPAAERCLPPTGREDRPAQD
jgi:hypothetical protein